MLPKRAARAGAVALALALVTSACASHRTGPDVTGAAAPAATAGGSAAGQERFGTLASPCGAGDAKGATDQGITDEQITVGYGDDRGFPSAPGLSKELGDAVSALIGWCNEQGGINGRTIKGNQYDAAYMQAPQVMQKACRSDFMLVGQGFAMDESAEQIRVGCNLPTVAGFTVGSAATMGPMHFEPVPYPKDFANTASLHQAKELVPGFEKKMDVLLSTSPGVTAGTDKIKAVLTSMGIDPLDCGVKFSQDGDSSYVPFAQKVKKCGAKALFTSDSPDAGQFSFLQSLDRVGADPALVYEATWYSTAVSKWNTQGIGDNLHIGMVFQPLENADLVPAVKKYVDLVEAEKGKTALLGMQAASAFLLWATAAKSCGSELTRQCMVDELSQVHEWTGGGLHAPTDPGRNMPTDCSLMLKLTGQEFRQIAPKKRGAFHCDKDYVVKTDSSTWGTELDKNRISTTFLTPDVIKPKP